MVVSGESGVLGRAAAPVAGPGQAGEMDGWISCGFGVPEVAGVELWLRGTVLVEERLVLAEGLVELLVLAEELMERLALEVESAMVLEERPALGADHLELIPPIRLTLIYTQRLKKWISCG